MRLQLYLLALAFVMFLGCQKEEANYPKSDFILEDTITLKYKSVYINSLHNISLTLDSINDSRCPINVRCFWEGNAAVWISSSVKKQSSNFDIHTHPNFDNIKEIDGYVFELIDVRPYPYAGKTIDKDEIEVDLVVREN